MRKVRNGLIIALIATLFIILMILLSWQSIVKISLIAITVYAIVASFIDYGIIAAVVNGALFLLMVIFFFPLF